MKYITTTLALLLSLTSVAQCNVYAMVESKDSSVDEISVHRISDVPTDSKRYSERFTQFKVTCFQNEDNLGTPVNVYSGSDTDYVFDEYGVYAFVASSNGQPTGGVSYLLVDSKLEKEYGSEFSVYLTIEKESASYTMQD